MSDADDVLQDYSAEDIDKAKEYFRLKKALKDLRGDIKDLKTQHEHYKELEDLKKKVKVMRDEMNEEESIKEMTEKSKQVKERMDLIKEMLRIEMIENAQEEVSSDEDEKVLKLVYVVKETKPSKKAS